MVITKQDEKEKTMMKLIVVGVVFIIVIDFTLTIIGW